MLHAFLFFPFFWFPFHGLITLIVIVLILSLIFGRRHHYYFGAPSPPTPPTAYTSRSDALSILESRYARGEIQREEYLQKKQDLSR